MIILSAQLAISLCLLAFGLVAVAMVRAIGNREPLFRFGWGLTAFAFLVQGLNSTFHDAFSTVAYLRGPESAAWAAVLAWHPILNHSRTFLLITYCLVLTTVLLLTRRGTSPPRLTGMAIIVLAGMAGGAVVGWNEDAFFSLTHFTAVALWDLVELFVMMGLLFVGLTSGGMERGLWLALGVNAFILALSVLLFAAFSQVEVGDWSPRPWHIQVTKALLYLLMLGIAIHQWVRVRNDRPLRGLLDVRTRSPVFSG